MRADDNDARDATACGAATARSFGVATKGVVAGDGEVGVPTAERTGTPAVFPAMVDAGTRVETVGPFVAVDGAGTDDVVGPASAPVAARAWARPKV